MKNHDQICCSGSAAIRWRPPVTTTVDEANDIMKRHGNTALIACFGEFNIIANQYEGIRDEDRA